MFAKVGNHYDSNVTLVVTPSSDGRFCIHLEFQVDNLYDTNVYQVAYR